MDQLSLIHSPQFPIERYREAFRVSAIHPISVNSLSEVGVNGRLNVVILDDHLAKSGSLDPGFSAAIVSVGLGEGEQSIDERRFIDLPADPPSIFLLSAIRRAYQSLRDKFRNERLQAELKERSQEVAEMSKVGVALSTVRDHDELLALILKKARELSRADAGSLYLIDQLPDQGQSLRWKLAQNDSIQVDFEEKVLPITKRSLAGYVALTGEPLVIDDAYQLSEGVEYSINRSFDTATGYLTKSLLVIPMTNHEGEIIGILQLINRKRVGAPAKLSAATVPAEVMPFDEHSIKLMSALAGQAAVALENNILYDSIERLFEGFVTAAVTAIEQRDPTTSGHSFRVADLTVELARTVDGLDSGSFRDIRFSADHLKEIRYASLLHDFGKVGVREKVLVKEKKFYPLQIEIIRSRFDYVIKATETAYARRKLDYAIKHGLEGAQEAWADLDRQMSEEITQLENDYGVISKSNEPTVLPEGDFNYLQLLTKREYADIQGQLKTLLTPEEAKILSIRKGNLDPTERGEIESHVTHTFEFLSKIPWTRDLQKVPDFAYAHHEKMNGRGYPRGLPSGSIPIQSRMMTVSDIYDALTANDRPYKKAVPTERALDILKMEMKDGLLDSEIVELFIDAKVFMRAGVVRA